MVIIYIYKYEGLTFTGTDTWNDRWNLFFPDLILNNRHFPTSFEFMSLFAITSCWTTLQR